MDQDKLNPYNDTTKLNFQTSGQSKNHEHLGLRKRVKTKEKKT